MQNRTIRFSYLTSRFAAVKITSNTSRGCKADPWYKRVIKFYAPRAPCTVCASGTACLVFPFQSLNRCAALRLRYSTELKREDAEGK